MSKNKDNTSDRGAIIRLLNSAYTEIQSDDDLRISDVNAISHVTAEVTDSYSISSLNFERHPIWYGVKELRGRKITVAKGKVDSGAVSSGWPVYAYCDQAECSEDAREEIVKSGIGEAIWNYCGRHSHQERVTDPLGGYLGVHELVPVEYGAVIRYVENGSTALDLVTFQLEPIHLVSWYMGKKAASLGVDVKEVNCGGTEILEYAKAEFSVDIDIQAMSDPFCLELFELNSRELLWPGQFKHNSLLRVDPTE